MYDLTVSRTWHVYTITNPEGRVYVGKTCHKKKRFNSHRNIKRQANHLLLKSIKEYGWDSHEVKFIDQFEGDAHYSDGREMFWIRSYMSNVNQYPEQMGFNLTNGGLGALGYTRSEEAKRKVGEFNSKNLKGKVQSRESVKKRADKMSIPILKYSLNGDFICEFSSVKEAINDLYPGLNRNCGHISEVAKGNRASYRGFIYRYKTDVGEEKKDKD